MTGALNTILTDPPYGDGVDEAKVSQLWSTLTIPMLTTLIKFNLIPPEPYNFVSPTHPQLYTLS